MTAKNDILVLSRVALCILVPGILLGIVWSAGSMRLSEYFLLTIIVLSSSFGVYVSRSKNKDRNTFLEKSSFYFGLVAVIGGVILNIIGIIQSPGVIFLLLILLPFVGVYLLKSN